MKMTIALLMEAAGTSETSVDVYQTTRRNNPEAIFNKKCFIPTINPNRSSKA
jgi:hypothetical protein